MERLAETGMVRIEALARVNAALRLGFAVTCFPTSDPDTTSNAQIIAETCTWFASLSVKHIWSNSGGAGALC